MIELQRFYKKERRMYFEKEKLCSHSNIISSGVLVLSATYSYARYLTSIDTSSDAVTAKWAVSVKEGSNELSSTQKLTLTVNENENVVAGKIAPGSTATGEFVIDSTGSEVAIDYEVKIDTTNMTNLR